MEFGVPREVRDQEMRVGLTPAAVWSLARRGHTVYVEQGAGLGSGFKDEDYQEAKGQIVYSAAEAYGRSDVVVKFARPTEAEYRHFRPGQMIFSFLHLPVASPDLYQALVEHQITAVAYEMIENQQGERPVLTPASEVAGRMTPIIAGQFLRSGQHLPDQEGLGILLSGVPGVPAATVAILGAGVLGTSAAKAFVGMGAEVIVLDNDVGKLRFLERHCSGQIRTMFANAYNLKRVVKFTDVLVGAVLISGQQSPILITREMVRSMRPGSVIIDYSIDEGGCVETSRPSTIQDPVYVAEGVIHHCVPNITSTVSRTTSYAVSNAALAYLKAVAKHGLLGAVQQFPGLAQGINLYQGNLTHPRLARALGKPVTAVLPTADEGGAQ